MSQDEVRLALVLAGYRSRAPDGVDADTFALATLTDCYEVLADLSDVRAGVVWPTGAPDANDLLWPGDLELSVAAGGASSRCNLSEVVAAVRVSCPEVTQLILIPADVPDLPGLVLAKVARALFRADVCCAPELGGDGLVALGLRLPVPAWLDDLELDLDSDPGPRLARIAPKRTLVARAPGWRRLRTPDAATRLDPRLEGWDHTRLLLGLA